MRRYYCDRLSGERLRRVYEVAPPRVRRYLEAEVEGVLRRISAADRVLELGCGYGRVLSRLAERAAMAVGVDTSRSSLALARRTVGHLPACSLVEMDAGRLGFRDGAFDLVACVQNGISAFALDQRSLIVEALRVVRPGGWALFSSYAERFWEERLAWFRLQARHGLLGEVDEAATGDGVIVCRDGFRATTVSPERFRALTDGLGAEVMVQEVDGSSVLCWLRVRGGGSSVPRPPRNPPSFRDRDRERFGADLSTRCEVPLGLVTE